MGFNPDSVCARTLLLLAFVPDSRPARKPFFARLWSQNFDPGEQFLCQVDFRPRILDPCASLFLRGVWVLVPEFSTPCARFYTWAFVPDVSTTRKAPWCGVLSRILERARPALCWWAWSQILDPRARFFCYVWAVPEHLTRVRIGRVNFVPEFFDTRKCTLLWALSQNSTRARIAFAMWGFGPRILDPRAHAFLLRLSSQNLTQARQAFC
jgi:hypothetical protein